MLCYERQHRDASTIVEHLAAAMVEQHSAEVIHMFDARTQDAARDVVQKNGVRRSIEEDELERDLQDKLDSIEIEEEESPSFKRRSQEVDELSVGTFVTQELGSANKKSCSESSKESSNDQCSARESSNSSAPE